MKVLLFGATGMIGQGVLRECLLDPGVEAVLAVVRKPIGQSHPKLRELVHHDFSDYSAIQAEISGYDACFFCLGVSSAGMSEAEYSRITFDFTLALARTLAARSPNACFIYVSGQGTDSSERGRSMWARVKGRTENACLALPFRTVYMFRPGFIRPLHGITSSTRLYRAAYAVLGPIYPLLKALAPDHLTTTEVLGRAMICAARSGAPKRVLETADINRLGEQP